MSSEHGRWIRIAAIVLGVLALGVLTWLLLAPLLPWWIGESAFTYAVDSIVGVSGWNEKLVQGVLLIVMIPFGLAIGEVFSFNPFRRRPWKGIAQIVIVCYIAGFWIVMDQAGRGNYFGRRGDAVKWYSVTPEGLRVFDHDGADPRYGVPLKPVTPDIAESIERARRGLAPQLIPVDRQASLQFFDGATGAPRVWYYRNADASYDLFSSAGFHPRLSEPLRPVDKTVVLDIQRQADDQVRRRVQLNAAAAAEARQHAASDARAERASRQRSYFGSASASGVWVAAMRGNRADAATAERIARAVGGSVLPDRFIADGAAQRLATGDPVIVGELDLGPGARLVVAAVAAATRRSDAVPGDVLTSDVMLSIAVARAGSRSVERFEARGTGSGFTADAAEKMAADRALAAVAERLRR